MQMRTLLLAASLAPALALGGCETDSSGRPGTVNRSLDSVHQPVVERTDYVFDVNVGPRGLAAGERGRLAGWLASMRVGYGDRVAIDDPSNGGNAARNDVAAEVARYGLLLSEEVPITAAPVAPGTARVVVSRARAFVPGCPDYTRVKGPDFESNTGSNFGCATNASLAAMVANPLDLVRGEPGTETYDAAQGTKAIQLYRKAAPTGAGGTVVKAEGTGKN